MQLSARHIFMQISAFSSLCAHAKVNYMNHEHSLNSHYYYLMQPLKTVHFLFEMFRNIKQAKNY